MGGVGVRHLRTGVVVAMVLVGATMAVSCGDDGESAQDRYCEAGDALRASIDELVSLDLIAQGTDGLQAAFDAVRDDVDELRDAATEASAEEVTALEESVDEARQALSDLGGSISRDNISGLRTAVEGVGAAASDVYATLSDCP